MLPRDLITMGMLKSIGIEKGKAFKPDAVTQTILRAAAQEAKALFIEGLTSYSQPWWPDRKWSPPDPKGIKSGFTFQTAEMFGRGRSRLGELRRFWPAEKDGRKLGVSLRIQR